MVSEALVRPARRQPAYPRVRTYGNDSVDSLPDLVQEWYHAVGTPNGKGNFAWAQDCLKKGVDVNARLDVYGGNALFLAIEQANVAMVKWLVEDVQVDLEMVDFGSFNAMDYAAACGFNQEDGKLFEGCTKTVDIAKYLKSKGMEYTWFGACIAGDIDKIWEFIENGQDVNERGGHFNRNGCQEALEHGHKYASKLIEVKGGIMGIMPARIQFPDESEVKAVTRGKLLR